MRRDRKFPPLSHFNWAADTWPHSAGQQDSGPATAAPPAVTVDNAHWLRSSRRVLNVDVPEVEEAGGSRVSRRGAIKKQINAQTKTTKKGVGLMSGNLRCREGEKRNKGRND